MHIVHLIERRFGARAGGVVAVLAALSISAIALGLGLLLSR
jgi:hypothetical protein